MCHYPLTFHLMIKSLDIPADKRDSADVGTHHVWPLETYSEMEEKCLRVIPLVGENERFFFKKHRKNKHTREKTNLAYSELILPFKGLYLLHLIHSPLVATMDPVCVMFCVMCYEQSAMFSNGCTKVACIISVLTGKALFWSTAVWDQQTITSSPGKH